MTTVDTAKAEGQPPTRRWVPRSVASAPAFQAAGRCTCAGSCSVSCMPLRLAGLVGCSTQEWAPPDRRARRPTTVVVPRGVVGSTSLGAATAAAAAPVRRWAAVAPAALADGAWPSSTRAIKRQQGARAARCIQLRSQRLMPKAGGGHARRQRLLAATTNPAECLCRAWALRSQSARHARP